MDKLKVLVYHNGHRLTLKDMCNKNFAFATRNFLDQAFHKVWMDLPDMGRAFDLELHQDDDLILVKCVQALNTGIPTYPRKQGPAAFPREFLEGFLNKSIIFQLSPTVTLQLHIVECDKDVMILSYSFYTLSIIIKAALAKLDRGELEGPLLDAVSKELKQMFNLKEDDLSN